MIASTEPHQLGIWNAMDLYFREVHEGEMALDARRSAEKQLHDMAEAVIAGRPSDIRLDTLVEPNTTFRTQQIDKSLDFDRFIDVLKRHNQLKLVLQNPLSFAPASSDTDAAVDPALQPLLREKALRSTPTTRPEAKRKEKILHESRIEGERRHSSHHLERHRPPRNLQLT